MIELLTGIVLFTLFVGSIITYLHHTVEIERTIAETITLLDQASWRNDEKTNKKYVVQRTSHKVFMRLYQDGHNNIASYQTYNCIKIQSVNTPSQHITLFVINNE